MLRHGWLIGGFLLILGFLTAAGVVSAKKIYHWTDETGTPHFTDRPENVPSGYRYEVGDYNATLEQSGRVTIIEGRSGPGEEQGATSEEPARQEYPPLVVPELSEIPQFAADPNEMLDRLKGPMMATAVVIGLVVFGFLFAFAAMCLLVGCRLVGQESPGFRKAYGVVIVQWLAGLVAGPGMVAIVGQPNLTDPGTLMRLQALNLGVMLLANAAVLRGMLCDSMGKSLGLALVENLVLLVMALLLGLGVALCAGGAALLSV